MHLTDPSLEAIFSLRSFSCSHSAPGISQSHFCGPLISRRRYEAAHRKDLRLIELTVRAGADVFVRNRKGKMAHEGAGT
jgi:hypothetical protein